MIMQEYPKSFFELNNVEKLVFILSGLGSAVFVREWQDIYIKASRFVHIMFRERANRYDTNMDISS